MPMKEVGMGNMKHYKIMEKGATAWNDWRKQNPKIMPDLSGLTLSGRYDEMTVCDFSGTNFSKSDFFQAYMLSSKLRKANFYHSNLYETNFRNADLRHANLEGASLIGANLQLAQLDGANFSKAKLGLTVLANVDLSQVTGLETVKHEYPSNIDIQTLYRSKGKIPAVFLRGCGAPDDFIEYFSSSSVNLSQYYSCFVSYSSKDQAFAKRLHTKLRENGVQCWFAPKDMKIGDRIRDRIDQSIRTHDKLLLILSRYSIKSEWVEDEVEAAYEQEQTRGKTVLFPISLDNAVMGTKEAWAAKLRRSRNVGDFTKWANLTSFKKAFDQLLRDLKAESK
jgi:uncharacterized protein YjbI with pentapeptide repeats